MSYFFDKPERVEALRAEANSWLGTPYRHWAGVKGKGCDCIHFVARVLEALGLGPYRIPLYPKDWHLHRSEERLEIAIGKQSRTVEVKANSVRNGDILLYRYGRTLSHSGLYLDGHIYGAITGVGVVKNPWEDRTMRSRLAKILRLEE